MVGEARRIDAGLAAEAVRLMCENEEIESGGIIDILNNFPGVGRRFERICDGLYTDYAHHPEEVAATVDVAIDEAKRTGRDGVVVVYQPHQNTRQHEVRDGYATAFSGVSKVLWLPTYLTREDPNLPVISAKELVDGLENVDAEAVLLNDELKDRIQQYLKDNYLVVLMTAGPADGWLRKNFA